ncbi:MAG TPA: aldo/keto reductase [Pirellulales bacterium]|jgi:diketogulonate reductase-like aldo/keto reductase|nr:aldo/keto reductase [Pirellulales bacterium]
MKAVRLPDGETVPALGLGSWNMGDDPQQRDEEIATLRLGLDAGATLIDTAEMYGDGRAESLIAEAIAGRRDEVFLVSKFYPQHASREALADACHQSLERLKTDRLDLYLLHWRGTAPFAETLSALATLKQAGKIRRYGVSNLDLADMRELWSVAGGSEVATDQVLYNLACRGIEWDLQPWLRERAIPIMAYSPLMQARLLDDVRLVGFAQRHGLTPAQAALGWLLAQDDVIVIPKTSRRDRLQENLAAAESPLTTSQVAELDELFPPPAGPSPLEML